MLVNQLFHVAVKTPNLEASRRFYVDVLGMTLAERPDLPFPGIWVQSPVPGGLAVIHVYAGDAAKEPDGSIASGSGVIDHVAITALGFEEIRERVKSFDLPWRENVVQGVGLWQLFVYDPSAVLLELSFLATAEKCAPPVIPEQLQYKAAERFFDPKAYQQFYG
jgi:catechol 2,3-dioxygenase-like lactoylglutathione lyase family enzyme